MHDECLGSIEVVQLSHLPQVKWVNLKSEFEITKDNGARSLWTMSNIRFWHA